VSTLGRRAQIGKGKWRKKIAFLSLSLSLFAARRDEREHRFFWRPNFAVEREDLCKPVAHEMTQSFFNCKYYVRRFTDMQKKINDY